MEPTVECLLCPKRHLEFEAPAHLDECYDRLARRVKYMGTRHTGCPICCGVFPANRLLDHVDLCVAYLANRSSDPEQERLRDLHLQRLAEYKQQQQLQKQLHEQSQEKQTQDSQTDESDNDSTTTWYLPYTPEGSPPPLEEDNGDSNGDENKETKIKIETTETDKTETDNDADSDSEAETEIADYTKNKNNKNDEDIPPLEKMYEWIDKMDIQTLRKIKNRTQTNIFLAELKDKLTHK